MLEICKTVMQHTAVDCFARASSLSPPPSPKKLFSRISVALLGASLLAVSPVQAQITWNWSFGTEAGRFITSGSGTPAAGTYTLSDFLVQSSGSGATIGSMSGGQYVGGGLSTAMPYSLDWNGSAVTKWNQSGTNSFNWWVFGQTSNASKFFLFGWQQSNINTVDQAAYFTQGQGNGQPSFKLTVLPTTTVPEPSTVILLAIGATAIVLVRGRRRA